MNLLYIWLAVFLISIIVEIATATALVSIWFALGALLAMYYNSIGFTPTAQTIIFLLVSILSLGMLRPIFTKKIKNKIVKTNADRVIGNIYTIIDDSENSNWATVKANGLIWNVLEENELTLDKGDLVEVVSIEGSKLIVSKVITENLEEGE